MWTQLSPTGGPPAARFEHTTVYDPATNRMVVFGGSSGSGLVPNDVWMLTNADGLGGTPIWSQLTSGGISPSRRAAPTSVYDPTSNRMIMFAGDPNAGNCFGAANDLWVLSNANGLGGASTWTQLSPAGIPPSPRSIHTAVYDPASNRMTVFGGNQACLNADSQVWVLTNANGLGGTPAWTLLTPIGITPGRSAHTAVYDPASNRMIVFGGCTLANSCNNNDVWVLTNANGLGGTPVWTQLTPTGGPPQGRFLHTAVYNSDTNTMTIFAGEGSAGFLNDVWVLSNANGLGGTPAWTQLTPTGGPPAVRYSSQGAVYNSTTNRMTIFAGRGCVAGSCYDLNDVWVLTNANGLGTGLCHEGDGDGEVKGNDPSKSHFHFHKNSCEGNNSGDVETDDEGSGTHFRSTSIDSGTFTADKDSQTVTMIGTGLNNGLPVGFMMVAVDNGYLAPGAFSLILTDGTSIIGNPAAGSILIQ